MSDPNKAAGLTDAAFGSESWRACLTLPQGAREHEFLRLYKEALRERGATKYVLSFAMHGDHGELLNWLFFCTNSLAGIEHMKKAMWKVDVQGTFRFSDKDDPGQLLLLNTTTDEWLAGELSKRLGSRRLTLGEVEEYVLVETPCYLFKKALSQLEKSGLLTVPEPPQKRRRGDFVDPLMLVEFAPPGSQPLSKEDEGLFGRQDP